MAFALQKDLNIELKRMVDLNIIMFAEEPTEWVNSVVLVRKSNGKLRLRED